ncbi:MAG TPA: hypothetical protein VII52_00565 [Gemmatimonadaceae bacterium]
MDEILEFGQVFRALQAWATAPSRGMRAGGDRRNFGHLQLHHRPDPRGPEVQLTMRAAVVDGRPVVQVHSSAPPDAARREAAPGESSSCVVVGPPPDERLGQDPEAVCEACGVVGTVGRAIRTDNTGAVIEAHRFCFNCWPEQSARYRARWMEAMTQRQERFLRGFERGSSGSGEGMSFEAATWHTTLDVVRQIEAAMIAPVPPTKEVLEQYATQIAANAPRLDGAMPFEVETFIRRYGRPLEA